MRKFCKRKKLSTKTYIFRNKNYKYIHLKENEMNKIICTFVRSRILCYKHKFIYKIERGKSSSFSYNFT